ncbi:MAG: LexA family transcriptional regulator [Fusobacteriaceae bacterium]|jgi:SOS-response transcriptional repressor LexA|nr:LexA family transcriptional regulator [Fusobacteriaceae bacterium]
MNFLTFLKNKREQLGYTQNKFAKEIGITQPYYNNIERGEVKNPPSEEVLDKMVITLKLDTISAEEFKYLAAVERTPNIVLKKIDMLNKKIKVLENALKEKNLSKFSETGHLEHLIPVFPRISAGLGALAEEEPTEYISIPGMKNIENLFAVRVNGDSMEPTIKNSSLILCRQCQEINNDEIGAFVLNDDAFVKRLKVTTNYVALISDNPNYNPIYIGPGENFKVVGRVIKVINDIA